MANIEQISNILENTAELMKKTQINLKKCPKQRLTKGYIQSRIQCIDEYWTTFKTAHLDLVKITPREQNAILPYFMNEEFYLQEDLYLCMLADLKDMLLSFDVRPAEQYQNRSQDITVEGQSQPQVRLPRIELPTFAGNYEEWPAYKDLFISLVHDNSSLTNVQRLHYLKTSITGEAATLLKHIQITDTNYLQAWDTLKLSDNVKIEKIKPRRPDGSKQAIHQVRRNIDKIKGIPCKPCKVSFKTQEEANEHKKEFHKYEGAVCEVCGKVFHNRSSMISHVRLHLPPTFNCEHCPYATVNKHDLKKHTHIHTGVKQYQCSECPRLFRTSSNVSQHVLRHHRQRLQHACNMCDKRFFDAYKLRRHLDSHNSIKRYECSVCHSHFTRRCYWKQHLLKQHGITTPPQRPGRQKLNAVIEKLCTSSQEAV